MLRQLNGEDWIPPSYLSISRQIRRLGVESPAATRVGGGKSELWLDSFSQTNKPIGGPGEARQSGNRLFPANAPFLSK